MTQAPDVLVVGAGPVGLIAAAELARHGVAVRIIDKLSVPTSESRAIAVHARSMDMLARMGTVTELIDTGVKARGMGVYAGSKQLFRVPLDGVDAAHPFSLNTPQTETERILTEHLASLGVVVERPVELIGLSQDADAVRVTLRGPDGREDELTASWVIGADGARSTVRHLVGGKLEGTFVGERFLLGDVDAEHELETDAMYTFFAADGPVIAMPMRHGRMRVMAQIHDAHGVPLNLHPSMQSLQDVVDDRVGNIRLVRAHWMTCFELHHAQVPQYRWGRVFLAGDAAHIHSPVGGQGMNTGMQDAFNLAWKLAAVINGEAGDFLLDSYHAERHPIARRMIAITDRLSKGGTLSGPAQHVRNTVLQGLSHVRPFTRALANWVTEVGIHYRNSPIVAGSAAPRHPKTVAGDHFPHLGGGDVERQLRAAWGIGHTTVTVTGPSGGLPTAGRRGRQLLVTDADTPVTGYDTVIADPQHIVAGRLGLPTGGRLAIRPDSYIGVIATLKDPAALDTYYATISQR